MTNAAIFSFIVKTYALGAFGYFLFRFIISPAHLKWISFLFINILIPCMILNTFLQKFSLDLLRSYSVIPFFSVLFIGLSLTAGIFIGKMLGIAFRKEFIAMLSFTNSGYIVLPMILEFFRGPELDNAMIVNFLYTMLFMLLMWSLGVYLMTDGKVKFSLKSVPLPFLITVISIILGILGVKKYVPGQVFRGLKFIGTMGIYGAMVVLGGILSQIRSTKEHRRDITAFLILKNIALPLVFLFFIHMFSGDPLISICLSLALITPPANNLAIIFERYCPEHDARKFVYPAMIASYLLAMITMPMFFILLKYFSCR